MIWNRNVHFHHSVVYLYFYIPEDKRPLTNVHNMLIWRRSRYKNVSCTFNLGGASTGIETLFFWFMLVLYCKFKLSTEMEYAFFVSIVSFCACFPTKKWRVKFSLEIYKSTKKITLSQVLTSGIFLLRLLSVIYIDLKLQFSCMLWVGLLKAPFKCV